MSVLSGLGGLAARKELLVKIATHSKDVIAATSRLERAARLMANVDRVAVSSLPTKLRRWTILRGPFKHKKAQEAFERRTHRRLLRVVGEASQIDKFAAYTEQHVLPDMYLSLKHVTVPRHDALLRFSLSNERSIRLAQQEEALRVRRHEDAEAQLAQLDKLRAEIDDAIAKVKESKDKN